MSTNFIGSPVGFGSSEASSTASWTSPMNSPLMPSWNTGRWAMLLPCSTPRVAATTVPWGSNTPTHENSGIASCS